MKKFLFPVLLMSTLVGLVASESMLRLKNRSMKNYDIEMWKYALHLKKVSENQTLGHEHQPSKTALLQSVTVRTNEFGLRGAPIDPSNDDHRRILFLGGSVTMGWGVPEERTLTELLKAKFTSQGKHVEVLNAGVGNFNATRYVELFFTRLEKLQPSDIVVHFALRDAEILIPANKNSLLRHSQLAATAWITLTRYFGKFRDVSLEEHYTKVYEPDSQGLAEMKKSLQLLAHYCSTHNIRLYLAMFPDLHDLTEYKFTFIHDKMKKISTELGYTYIDLYPALRNLTPEEVWAMPGDPHPNALGHQRMSETIFPVLALN